MRAVLVFALVVAAGWAALLVAAVRFLTSSSHDDIPDAWTGDDIPGEDRYLFTTADALTTDLIKRSVGRDRVSFIGVDARGGSFIAHVVAVPAAGRDRHEIWVFDDVDDVVTLSEISFPVTGEFIAGGRTATR